MQSNALFSYSVLNAPPPARRRDQTSRPWMRFGQSAEIAAMMSGILASAPKRSVRALSA